MDNYKFGLGELSFDNYNNLITISEYTEHNLNNNVIKLKKIVNHIKNWNVIMKI